VQAGSPEYGIRPSDIAAMRRCPSSSRCLAAVTAPAQLVAPLSGTQQVYLFHNKQIFSSYHLTFPMTWSGLLSTVATLKSHDVAPISLAEGDQWPGLMYLEYLADRVGGPSVADALESNTKGAWSNPAVTQALTDIQQLVKAGAFQSRYNSLRYSGGGAALGRGRLPPGRGSNRCSACRRSRTTYSDTLRPARPGLSWSELPPGIQEASAMRTGHAGRATEARSRVP